MRDRFEKSTNTLTNYYLENFDDSYYVNIRSDTGIPQNLYYFEILPKGGYDTFNSNNSYFYPIINIFNAEKNNTKDSTLIFKDIENTNNLEFLIGRGNNNSDYYYVKYNKTSENFNLLTDLKYFKTDGYKDFLWYKNEPFSYSIRGNIIKERYKIDFFTFDSKEILGNKLTTDNELNDNYLNNLWIFPNSNLFDTPEFFLGNRVVKRDLYPKNKLTMRELANSNNIKYFKNILYINKDIKYNLEYINQKNVGSASVFMYDFRNEKESKPIDDVARIFDKTNELSEISETSDYPKIFNYNRNTNRIINKNGIKTSIKYKKNIFASELGLKFYQINLEKHRNIRNYFLPKQDYSKSKKEYDYYLSIGTDINRKIPTNKSKKIGYDDNINVKVYKYFLNNVYNSKKLKLKIDGEFKRKLLKSNFKFLGDDGIFDNEYNFDYKSPNAFSLRNNIIYKITNKLNFISNIQFNEYFFPNINIHDFVGEKELFSSEKLRSDDFSIGLNYKININSALEINYININYDNLFLYDNINYLIENKIEGIKFKLNTEVLKNLKINVVYNNYDAFTLKNIDIKNLINNAGNNYTGKINIKDKKMVGFPLSKLDIILNYNISKLNIDLHFKDYKKIYKNNLTGYNGEEEYNVEEEMEEGYDVVDASLSYLIHENNMGEFKINSNIYNMFDTEYKNIVVNDEGEEIDENYNLHPRKFDISLNYKLKL